MATLRPLVLVVEDNHVVRLVAISNLKRFADVEIRIAQNGLEAVQLVKQHHFSLVLMDIHMPQMDGLEATRAIRELDKLSGHHTPIVAVTASDTRERCLDAGMDDYVSKPVDYRRVLHKWLPPDYRRMA